MRQTERAGGNIASVAYPGIVKMWHFCHSKRDEMKSPGLEQRARGKKVQQTFAEINSAFRSFFRAPDANFSLFFIEMQIGKSCPNELIRE